MSLPVSDAPVLYPGVIVVTPVCPLTPKSLRLEPVRLDVSAPGRAPAAEDAIRRAVAAAGTAFSRCAPTRDQEWLMGISRTRSGTSFSARCGALVLHNRAFVVVLLGIVSPPRAPAIHLYALASELSSMKSIGVKSAVAVSVWRFVVSTEELRQVGQFRGPELRREMVRVGHRRPELSVPDREVVAAYARPCGHFLIAADIVLTIAIRGLASGEWLPSSPRHLLSQRNDRSPRSIKQGVVSTLRSIRRNVELRPSAAGPAVAFEDIWPIRHDRGSVRRP